MKPPIASMTKKEIVQLFRWRCKHGHTGLSHYNCWRAEQEQPERLGFLDIECTNLKADFGMMLSWCMLRDEDGVIVEDAVSKKDLRNGTMDKNIVQSCIDEMEKYDRVVGHYSSRFDIPFVRSRALWHGLKFPHYGEILQTDTWTMAKRALCISSNRQDSIARLLHSKTEKTRIEPRFWLAAMQGDEKAIEEILDHNRRDVRDLKRNYDSLKAFCKASGTSI